MCIFQIFVFWLNSTCRFYILLIYGGVYLVKILQNETFLSIFQHRNNMLKSGYRQLFGLALHSFCRHTVLLSKSPCYTQLFPFWSLSSNVGPYLHTNH